MINIIGIMYVAYMHKVKTYTTKKRNMTFAVDLRILCILSLWGKVWEI